MGNRVNQNPYGNIQRIGTTQNNRTVYRVINSNGQDAGKLTIPQAETDKFEKAYIDIIKTAPKIQNYVANHSSEADIKKRRTISGIIIATGGVLGTAIPLLISRNTSTLKKILYTVTGVVAGISAGFAGSLLATMPPGTIKFAKATKTLSRIDIQPVIENTVN